MLTAGTPAAVTVEGVNIPYIRTNDPVKAQKLGITTDAAATVAEEAAIIEKVNYWLGYSASKYIGYPSTGCHLIWFPFFGGLP